MYIFLGILLTLVVFTLVVFLHELGHFLTARFTGMKVLEFGIGIPPKAKSIFIDKKGTEYTLNWLPIGGFVRIKGEDPGAPDAFDKDAFSSKRWWARSLVLIAGVTMNFILAYILFFVLLISGSHPLGPNFITPKDYQSYFLPSLKDSLETGYITQSGVLISSITGSIAESAGIGKDEYVKSVNGKPILLLDDLGSAIKESGEVSLVLSNSGTERTINLIPKDGKVGIMMWYGNMHINRQYSEQYSLYGAMRQAGWETFTLSRLTFDVIRDTVVNLIAPPTPTARKEASEMLAGPIGMSVGFIEIIKQGLTFELLLLIVAMLSLNLGVLNILPFPALDGGRIFSTSIMAFVSLFTKKNSFLIKLERIIHGFGMLLLLLVSIIIAIMDIIKI